MKKTLIQIIPIFVVVFVASACGSNKLMKNGTPEEKYEYALSLLNGGKNQRAVDLFSSIQPMFIGKPQQVSIGYFIALGYYRMRDYETSGMLFDQFRQTYGNGRSNFIEDAEFLYADGLYRSSPDPNHDQSATMSAIVAIDEYLERYPNSKNREYMLDNMEELQNKLKEKSFINAKVYYDIGQYKAAVVAFGNSLDRYPDTPYREEILYLITKSNYLLARNSISSLQRERYMNVVESYYNLIGEYPQSRYLKEVEKMHEESQEFLSQFSSENSDSTNTSNTQDGN